MTIITIQDDVQLPQTEFKTLNELRDILNFLALNFEKISEKNLDAELLKKHQETKNIPLSKFNYLTDESV